MISPLLLCLIKWMNTKKIHLMNGWMHEVKQDLLNELKDKWQAQTEGKCVFISATEKTNIA